MKVDVYCTSFCNFGHSTKTGRPIGHECYIIPPSMLKIEMEGGDDMQEKWETTAVRLKWRETRYLVKGRRGG